jgi:hypothetical protein
VINRKTVDRICPRIRGFAPHLLRRFAFVLEARLTGAVPLAVAIRIAPAADRTPVRSHLHETYDRNRSSQKTLVNEALTVPIVGRLDRL